MVRVASSRIYPAVELLIAEHSVIGRSVAVGQNSSGKTVELAERNGGIAAVE